MTMSAELISPTLEDTLATSSIPYLRRLSVRASADEVVITGRVPSYYLKQLAQEAVRGAVGSRRLLNRVEVTR